jgi:Domain of unknown function (DUF4338)/Transposase Tn5 dimerisation domain/Transposase DNA-binding
VEILGQQFSAAVIERLQRTCEEEPGLSRTALSRRVCAWLEWRAPNGRWKEMSCRVALGRLERAGMLHRPRGEGFVVPPRRWSWPGARAEKAAGERCLQDLQPIEVVPVGSAESRLARTWNELLERYHPHGAGPLCGAQMRYAIRSRGGAWLGGLAFSAAAWRVAARDRWIGWSDAARREHLPQVIANSRFLLLPGLHVPHLASHVLGRALRRVRRDWRARYGYEPCLVETFVEGGEAGTCYRAANWMEVGQTAGRGRQDRRHERRQSVKRIFVYAWQRQARQQLGGGPPAPAPPPADWAEEEFAGARLGDARLTQRLLQLARDLYARPQANLPQACQTRARTKAAYRFLQHSETTMEALLQPHLEATRQRLAAEPVVLAVQDTTSLNYTTPVPADDLGPISSSAEGAVGLWLHSTLAFNREGTPLGLLEVQCWARDAQTFGKRHQRKDLPIEKKESFKWVKSYRALAEVQKLCPQTRLISVGDREADIYELFREALGDAPRPGLLVRAEHDRLRAEGEEHLWPWVEQQGAAGVQEIRVPRRGAQAARVARLEVRYAPVTLRPPHTRPDLPPLTLWAVLAQEAEAPAGSKPLRWMLLTTCAVESFAAACEKLHWYTLRWGIEVYHRTLKSGCQIEQRQLGTAERIEACLAIDLVVAWRIYHLAKLGRETPAVPCTVYFEDAQWKALLAYLTKNPVPPAQPPSLNEAMRLVASLGGFLGRKGDGHPGTQTLWLGLQRLDDITETYKVFAPLAHSPPVSSRRCG